MPLPLRLQELQHREAITNPDGTPSTYFLQYLKSRGGSLTDLEAELALKVPQTRRIDTDGGLQGGGDLSADRTLSLTDTGVTPGTYSNPTIVVDAKGRITNATNGGGSRVISISLLTTALAADEVFAAITPPIGETWTFAGNFSGASGKKISGGTNPASTFTIVVKKNGTNCGTIVISTAGVVTFTTTGAAAVSLIGGTDEMQFVGPSTTGTAVGFTFALPATL